MIELFIFLFVLQGDTPSDWLESCNIDFSDYNEKLQEITPDVYFCNVVRDLQLTESDVEKLGTELNWFNYTMQTSKEFVDNWSFYQDNVIEDTLLIYPSIGTRDSLPPGMKVTISFNYTENGKNKFFEEPFTVNPLNTLSLCNDTIENLSCLPREFESYSETDEEITSPQFGLDCPTTTHKFSQETQNCEIWWNSAYVGIPILILIVSASIVIPIIVWKYRKKVKNE